MAEANGSRIYKVGRVGYDSGNVDAGGAYTGNLRTGKISPQGEDGLCLFRRVVMRIWRTGQFTITFTIYVDGVQTQILNSSGAKVPQTIVITKPAPVLPPEETVVECSISAQGTYIEVEADIVSTSITGTFLPEELECHYIPVRPTKARSNAQSQ